MLTQERLKAVLSYDPETGAFIRLVSTCSRTRAGTVAGSRKLNGYLSILIDGKRFYLHRLAWLYMTGGWPNGDIDNINMDRRDNRWCNLREATRSQNKANAPANRRNKSGFKGVHFDTSRGKWLAQIVVAGRHYHLGRFEKAEEAHTAYSEATRRLNGEYARAS
jgi:hypothetical protein